MLADPIPATTDRAKNRVAAIARELSAVRDEARHEIAMELHERAQCYSEASVAHIELMKAASKLKSKPPEARGEGGKLDEHGDRLKDHERRIDELEDRVKLHEKGLASLAAWRSKVAEDAK